MHPTHWDPAAYAAAARQAAAEGIVLLKNDRKALPLHDGERLSLFGRAQFHYYKSGTGSGGSVNTDYVVGIRDALEQSGRYRLNTALSAVYEAWLETHPFDAGQGWAAEPWFQEEMPLSEDLVRRAAEESDVALVLIGRTAGEDQDNRAEAGSFLLTETERDMLALVCRHFPRTAVLLNTGNILDMGWVREFDPAAVLYVWQGGQEGGNAVLDVLSGDVNPSGRLADTVAERIDVWPSFESFGSKTENVQTEDLYVGYRYFETFCPQAVLYPFGFGLSYTSFQIETEVFSVRVPEAVSLSVSVRNTGAVSGKQVVQIYGSAPQGALGKPARVLIGFGKTSLLAPGDSQTLHFDLPLLLLASYDDSGRSGHRSAWVLEQGEYRIEVGADVRSAAEAGRFTLAETVCVRACEEAMAPVQAFDRLRPEMRKEAPLGEASFVPAREPAPLQTVSPLEKRLRRLPSCLPYAGDRGWKLRDAAEGRRTMQEFLSQLSDADLCAMVRGEGMCSPKVTPGIAGAFGGVTEALKGFGIPVGGCSDGPSGIRMDCGTHAFSLPNGTCLACSFNEELNEELFAWEGLELRRNRIDCLLGPGMNIHRNPLNGRNFEYFSEDPLLTGRMASAQLRGLHRFGVTGVIKHFCANTQETLRHHVNAVISERALREVYLRGFEIAVREGHARAVMSTYGPVNGLWTSGNYDLLTAILRGEWGFKGVVMTDWWAMANDAAGLPGNYQNVSAQVRAQNDLNMVNADAASNSNEDDLASALSEGRLTRAELVRSAENICRFLLTLPCWPHSLGQESDLDLELRESLSEEDLSMHNAVSVVVDRPEVPLDAALIRAQRGETSVLAVTTPHRGIVRLELEARAVKQPRMAQLPFSVFQDRELVREVTLTGADTEWTPVSLELKLCYTSNFLLRFYFAQSGLELRNLRLVLAEDLEEQFRKAQAEARATDRGNADQS